MKSGLFRILVLLIGLVPGVIPSGPRAQEVLRIAAVVNDEVISVLDLHSRLAMVAVFAGLPDTPQNRQRLASRVLHEMIDEKLKFQEASRVGIKVSEDEIGAGLKRIEQINDLGDGNLDSYLKRSGIHKPSLIDRVKTDIAWNKLIAARFRNQIQISETEVDDVLAEMERNVGQPENRVSEIFVPVDSPSDERDAGILANKLLQQLKSGARFAAIARDFSGSPTAAVGGDLGWVRVGQLARELDQVIQNLQPGNISEVVRSSGGFFIFFLRDRRKASGFSAAEIGSPVVTLYQVHYPLSRGAGPAEVARVMEEGKKRTEKAASCADMEYLGKRTNSPLSGALGNLKTDDLSPQLRSLVRGLPALKPSQPLRTEDGVIVLMVCEREAPVQETLDRADHRRQVEQRLADERLNLSARQYLRDLRRSAFVDVRI